MNRRQSLRVHARLVRTLTIACCALLIAAGGFTHALTHFAPRSDIAAGAANHVDQHEQRSGFVGCALDLAFGAFGHFLNATPPDIVGPVAADVIATAVQLSAVDAVVLPYRSRAPPEGAS